MNNEFQSLRIALLTVSDTRNLETDRSGNLILEKILEARHQMVERTIVPDDIYQIRAVVSQWIAAKDIEVILTTGGTGVTGRDTTPEALVPLFDTTIEGFGELFRWISFQEIGTSTIQSRAIAGVANGTFLFCLPGSTNACKTAWEEILVKQLDSRHRPCNFSQLIPRLSER